MIILHVEDDEDIRDIAKMALEMMGGFTVIQQDCGEAAISIAAEIKPDVLLLYQWPEYLTHFFGFKFWQTLNQ